MVTDIPPPELWELVVDIASARSVSWNVVSNPLLDGFFEVVSISACFPLQG